MKKITILVSSFILIVTHSFAQCATSTNVFTFSYNGNDYEVIKENKTWEQAAACAVERGGSLARIDTQEEQDAIFNALMNDAGIILGNTVSPDGGGASYVWLGANDMASEGVWIWDGDNDGVGDQFWQGNTTGFPMGGLYNNWGTEPDNYQGHQHAAAIALTEWPLGSGSLGSAGQWNDVYTEPGAYEPNELYYLIEYIGTTGISDYHLDKFICVYPNPVSNRIFVKNYSDQLIIRVSVLNQLGKLVLHNSLNDDQFESIDISKLNSGLYSIIFESEQGDFSRKLIVIEH
jgi:hypothetical protein